jgi:transglutaminase-like putative cysteine protease
MIDPSSLGSGINAPQLAAGFFTFEGLMDAYLAATEIVDWQHPAVLRLARDLADESLLETANRCFEWVRDEIRHSYDFQLNPVTCSASEVLEARTGYCYAKSHLLAALLRANHIPAGFCYQRLRLDENEERYALHGLNAVYLPEYGWYRVDARGNKNSVNAQFTPPVEQLAFRLEYNGEADLPSIWTDPLPEVIKALRSYETWDQLMKNLPDVSLPLSAEEGEQL